MAKKCKTITISSCPPSGSCTACKEIISAGCVKYYGEGLNCVEVDYGDRLDEILVKIDQKVCNASSDLCIVPQASVKLHRATTVLGLPAYTFFSSSGPTPVGCAKSYKIFDTDDAELFAGTLQGAISFSLQELDKDTPYYLVEYIDCGDCGTTESQDQCFKVTNTELARIIQKSCDCC